MSADVEVETALLEVKRALRARGITYPVLARQLGVSLPTVKRLMNQERIPLRTLADVAGAAGLSLVELFSRAAARKPRITFFNDLQDEAFCARPALLLYFQLLADGLTPADIAKKHGLSKATTVQYLAHLERAGLVEVLPFDRVRLLVVSPFGFSRKSKYLKREFDTHAKAVLTRVLAKMATPQQDMILLKPMRLTADEYGAMKEELKEIVERYARLDGMPRRRGARGRTREIVALVVADEYAWPAPSL